MVRNVDFFCLMVVALRFLTRGINLLAGALLTHYNSELEAARAHGAALDEQNESALKAAGDACCAAMRSAHARHAVACRERFRREVLANKPFWRFEQKLLAPHSHSIAKPSRENGVPPAVAAAEQGAASKRQQQRAAEEALSRAKADLALWEAENDAKAGDRNPKRAAMLDAERELVSEAQIRAVDDAVAASKAELKAHGAKMSAKAELSAVESLADLDRVLELICK